MIGDKSFIMMTLRDMSTWIESEKQKNISYYKTVAFAQAAHEFRNPLNGIISSLELLGVDIENAEDNKYYKVT